MLRFLSLNSWQDRQILCEFKCSLSNSYLFGFTFRQSWFELSMLYFDLYLLWMFLHVQQIQASYPFCPLIATTFQLKVSVLILILGFWGQVVIWAICTDLMCMAYILRVLINLLYLRNSLNDLIIILHLSSTTQKSSIIPLDVCVSILIILFIRLNVTHVVFFSIHQKAFHLFHTNS